MRPHAHDPLAYFMGMAQLAAARITGDASARATIAYTDGGHCEITVAMPDVEFTARAAHWGDAARSIALAMREHVRAMPAAGDAAMLAVAGLVYAAAPGGVTH